MYREHKVRNEILVFIKRHAVICVLCVVSAFIIAKKSRIPAPNWLPNVLLHFLLHPTDGTISDEWLNLLNNLSLAFIGSIITYVIVQYIPERRKAYHSFSILRKELCNLYLYMSQLIDMYLFEIGIHDPEDTLSEESVSKICNVEIKKQFKDCKIRQMCNGNFANMESFGYNLYGDSKKYLNPWISSWPAQSKAAQSTDFRRLKC